MDKACGFTLVELMIVVAVLGILLSVAVPQYLKYMEGAKVNAAVENFDALARIARAEAAKRNFLSSDGTLDVLALIDPNYAVPGSAMPSPFINSLPAYAQGAAPAGDGQVAMDVINFSRAATPTGTVVNIRVDLTNDGAAGIDRTHVITLE